MVRSSPRRVAADDTVCLTLRHSRNRSNSGRTVCKEDNDIVTVDHDSACAVNHGTESDAV